MATKRKTGTLAAAGKTVKKAAQAVIDTADEYVVEPVGQALGLTKKKTTAKKKATARPAATKAKAKRPATRGTAAKSTAAKRTSKSK